MPIFDSSRARSATIKEGPVDLDIIAHKDHTEARLSGQFTFADNQTFRQVLQLVQSGKVPALVLDFSGVNFIDSAGLGMLLMLRDECLNKNIPLFLRAVQGQVEKIFTISKFDQLFTIQP